MRSRFSNLTMMTAVVAFCCFQTNFTTAQEREPANHPETGTIAAEIAGPDGMIKTYRCRFGVQFQTGHTDYAEHSHAAEELYMVLAGQGEWRTSTTPPKNHSAGEFIHHAPFQPHAITTHKQPVLSLWGWTGDLDLATYRLHG